MTFSLNKIKSFVAWSMVTFVTVAAPAQSTVTVTLDPQNAGRAISPDFIGLSFETEKILAAANGAHYFSATNQALIATFKTLGIKNLRIGGNTSDRATVKLPTEADVDNLFAFAKAAGAKVIYTLRLRQGDPQAAATMAKYIHDRYGSQLACFAIGNEPSAYGKDYSYSVYRGEWKKIMETIVAAVPDAKFCGANVHTKPEWARQFATDFGPSGHVVLITEHYYPGGSAYAKASTPAVALTDEDAGPTKNNSVPKNPALGRDQMLSAGWLNSYQKLSDGFVPTIRSNGLPYRLEEANNFFHGGLQGASDSFASALWALDYAYWWAAHDCAGINFHTGDVVAAGGRNTACRYATFLTAPDGYDVHPIGYGEKAFILGSNGRLVAAKLSGTDNLNLTAYAVLGQDDALYVTLINKEHGAGARAADATIVPNKACGLAQAMFLASPNGDLSATSGVTLGGAEIKNDASWKGQWTALPNPSKDGQITVKLPAATAVVVKLAVR